MKTKTHRSQKRRSGTGFIEFAFVAPVLIFISLGIIDFGLMGRNSLIIANAAREGARAAALGQSTANIRTRIINAATPPFQFSSSTSATPSNGSIVMEQATAPTLDTQSAVFQAWPTDNGTKNGVLEGRYVRITVNFTHRSLTGMFNRSISMPVVMRREGA